MKISPILPFNAVVPGSAYPKTFTTDDEFEPGSVEAKAAYDLGCLSEDDRAIVADAIAAAEEPQTISADDDADADAKTASASKPAAEKKASKAAPENKAGEAEG